MKLRYAVMVSLGIIAVFAFWWAAKEKPTPETITDEPVSKELPAPDEYLQHTAVQAKPSPVVDQAAIRSSELVNFILTTPANLLTPKNTSEYIAELLSLGDKAWPAIESLLASDYESERILGIFLALEVGGYTEEIKEIVSEDSSPFVQAQPSLWLFLNHKFDEWEKFSEQMGESLSNYQIQKLFESFDKNPPRMESIPPGLTHLGLTNPLEIYTRGMISTNSKFFELVSHEILDETSPKERRYALLELVHEANPQGYDLFLKEIIDSEIFDTTIYRSGLIFYGAISFSPEDFQALEKVPVSLQGNMVVSKTLTDVDKVIRDNIDKSYEDFSRLGDQLLNVWDKEDVGVFEKYSMAVHYAEQLKYDSNKKPDPVLSNRLVDYFKDFQPMNQNQEFYVANALYILEQLQ